MFHYFTSEPSYLSSWPTMTFRGSRKSPSSTTNDYTTRETTATTTTTTPQASSTDTLRVAQVLTVEPRGEGWVPYFMESLAPVWLLGLIVMVYAGFGLILYTLWCILTAQWVPATKALAFLVAEQMIPNKKFAQDTESIKHNPYMREFARYFSMVTLVEEKLDPGKSHLIASYPHGFVPASSFVCSYFLSDMIPGKRTYALVHTALYHTPFIRHVISGCGGVPADKENLAEIKRQGENAMIVVGGVREMFLQSDEVEKILMRRGFIREAIRHGFQLVPCYHFGNTRLFRPFGRMEWWQRLARMSPVPIFFFYGRWCLPLPYKRPVVTVIGRPLDVNQLLGRKAGCCGAGEDPTREEVELVSQAFTSELKRIYDTYKPAWETRPLVIMDAPSR